MIIVNLIKVGAIWLCDLVNRCWDPFRQAVFPLIPTNLPELEGRLFDHLELNHVVNGKFAYQVPMPEDVGDYALFQGLYLGMLALKNTDLADAVVQLDKLFINDILVRGIRADGTPNDTASNDSATGVIFGLWASNNTALAARWARRICDSGYALTDLKGVPTQYGQLEQGWKTDPLRITLLLAILAMARMKDSYFDGPYYELFHKYRSILAYPKVKLLWLDTDYDTHRAAIHLHILHRMTGTEEYAEGLRRIHRIMRKSNNAWVEALCAPALDRKDVNLSMLGTFTYEDRIKGAVQSINSGTVDSVNWPPKFPSWLGFLGETKERARQTLPMSRRGSQEFFWQRNMFSLDEWVGLTEPYVWHSGLDFLVCYWLAKRQGLL